MKCILLWIAFYNSIFEIEIFLFWDISLLISHLHIFRNENKSFPRVQYEPVTATPLHHCAVKASTFDLIKNK